MLSVFSEGIPPAIAIAGGVAVSALLLTVLRWLFARQSSYPS